jgi:hypothetical protein
LVSYLFGAELPTVQPEDEEVVEELVGSDEAQALVGGKELAHVRENSRHSDKRMRSAGAGGEEGPEESAEGRHWTGEVVTELLASRAQDPGPVLHHRFDSAVPTAGRHSRSPLETSRVQKEAETTE